MVSCRHRPAEGKFRKLTFPCSGEFDLALPITSLDSHRPHSLIWIENGFY